MSARYWRSSTSPCGAEGADTRQAARGNDFLGRRDPEVEVLVHVRRLAVRLDHEVRLVVQLEVVDTEGAVVADHAPEVTADGLEAVGEHPQHRHDAPVNQALHEVVVGADVGAIIKEDHPLHAHVGSLGDERIDDLRARLHRRYPVDAHAVVVRGPWELTERQWADVDSRRPSRGALTSAPRLGGLASHIHRKRLPCVVRRRSAVTRLGVAQHQQALGVRRGLSAAALRRRARQEERRLAGPAREGTERLVGGRQRTAPSTGRRSATRTPRAPSPLG